MAASWPGSVKNFGPAHQDFTETIIAAHVNDLQDEVVAMQSNLGTTPHVGQALDGTGTTYATLKARIDAIMAGVKSHTHDGTLGVKLAQANTHQSADTDTGTASLHHTIGTSANQAAAGNHGHAAADVSGLTGHIAATAAHGATGAVMGTTNVQSPTNKDMTDATNLFPVQMPIGSMIMWPGSAPPSPTTTATWLLCDGTAVSRTTYAAVFAIVGSAFGSGDGLTTFNLPDMRLRYPLGAGTGHALGSSEGQALLATRLATLDHSHVHATANSATHTHTTDAQGSHSHGQATTSIAHNGNSSATGGADTAGGGHDHNFTPNVTAAHTHTAAAGGVHAHAVNSASGIASGTEHAFTAVNYIIRVT